MKIEEGKVYKRRDGLKAFYVKFDGDLIEEWKEEKMPKFKVGDFVTADGWSNPSGLEICAIDSESYWLNINTGPYPYSIYVWDSKLKLATQTPKSPVVEKTVKSIEPGVYGKVLVGMEHFDIDPPKIAIGLTEEGQEIVQLIRMTAEELESAAKTFMELAEYLRGRE